MYFVVENVLTKDALANVRKLAQSSEYVDGAATAGYDKSKKNNREMRVSEPYVTITEIVERAVKSSNAIERRILPRYLTHPILNRYGEGMFYHEHIDAPIQGEATQFGRAMGRFGQNFIRTDYSMTLFISEPSEYDGGELELHLFDDVKLVKLPAGSAVFYATGIPHSVRPVTRGTRLAAIMWFQSMIKDNDLRSILWDQHVLEERLLAAGNKSHAEAAGSVRSNLIRSFADI